MRAQEFITEGAGQKPIIIYTNNRGATIDDDIKKSLPVTQISFDKLHMWESHKSMKDLKVADWVNNKLLPELEQNGILKPLLVWNNNGEFFVIDGNHRFIAYQEAGYQGRVPVQIVPDNMITVSDTVPGQQGMAENKAAGIDKMFNNLGDPVYANLQRVALLAMQGRQSEAAGRLQTVIKDADPAVQKKITDAVNNIKPVTINGRVADSSTLDKSKQHNDWITNTFIPWVQSLLGQQGVAEARKNPEQNTKYQSGWAELAAWARKNNVWLKPHEWAISMTYVPKLGINPGPGISEDTPRGIYFYPFQWAYSVKMDKEALPWADNAPYIQLFQYSTGTELYDPNQIPLASAVAQLKNYGITDEDIAAEKENYPSISTYNLLVWCLGRKYDDNKRVSILNKVLRNLGYDYMIDNGKGWIAINEPTQGVVLNPKIIDKVVTFNNYTRKKEQGVAENFADGKNPIKFTVTTPDGYTHSFQITLAVHGKHVGHFNFVRSADTDDVNNEAEVESRWQGQGYGKLLLMKAIDVANNHGLDFQQDIRGITHAQQNVYDSLENAGSIVTPGDGFWFLTPQGEQELNGLNENFADGKNPQDKGDSKRHGVPTKSSVSTLRKVAKQGGRKGQLAHWMANMKAGRARAKRNK